MSYRKTRTLAVILIMSGVACSASHAQSDTLFRKPADTVPRWSSFENPTGGKGQAGQENKTAKGHAFDEIPAGTTRTLMETDGPGVVRRIWLTINNRKPAMLRALRIEMFWDGAAKPAVSCPLGDFFGIGLGRKVPFENALFSDPQGRSFNCCIPMPFRKHARITITNDSDKRLAYLFYDVDYTLGDALGEDMLYFHTHWRRENPAQLGQDFTILPRVLGKGRFLGSNLSIRTDPIYDGSWWGEGEVKVYLDGDTTYPTLAGTGTEDYIGTAWGQGQYIHRYQGCSIADGKKRQWAFYRFHIPDPIYFDADCRVTIQQIGGTGRNRVREILQRGAPLIPVSIDSGGGGQFTKLLDSSDKPDLFDESLPDGHCNFYRRDDWTATAYFYLDRPANNLPPLTNVAQRTANLDAGDE